MSIRSFFAGIFGRRPAPPADIVIKLPESPFVSTYLPQLEEVIARNAAARSLDEATGGVFDDLIDAWRGSEDARLDAEIDLRQAQLRHDQAELVSQRTQLREQLDREELEWLRVNEERLAAVRSASLGVQ